MLPRFLLTIVAGFAFAAPAFSSTGPARHHKIQVRTAAGEKAVLAHGGRLIANYGGFKLYDVPESGILLPETANVRDDYNSIFLNATNLDTSTAAVKALRQKAGTFADKRLHLIHFAGPVQPAWRQALVGAGVKIVNYIPQNAYLVYGDSASIAKVQALSGTLPQIQWDGPFTDDYKIHPNARTVDKLGHLRAIGTDRFAVQLVDDPAANADTLKLIDQLKLAPIERNRTVLQYVDVVVRLVAADVAKIAARPDVISIQAYGARKKVCERQDQIVAGSLSGNVPTGPGYLAWLESKGFTQAQFDNSGFVVDVSDSGIDNGTTSPNHFGLYAGGDINSESRVVYNILEGTPNQGSTLAGCDGHGNLNAHIISGYDDSSGFPFTDSSGFHYGLGVCPFARVGSSVIFDPDESTGADDTTTIDTAYANGARISNNSWGDSVASDDGSYNVDCQEYDALVRDAEPNGSLYPANGNQEMVIVFAAGNDGDPSGNGKIVSGSVSPPGTAKNVITVGAAQNVQPFGGCDGSGVCDNGADNANSIIDFSSRGPCDDGRRKPDIMAPGTHVSGGAPQQNRTQPFGTGEALSCFLSDGDGVSGGVGTGNTPNLFFPDGQQFYTASSGTSHSTPCVTGACALVRQYFLNTNLPAPSPAMTKAFLMNSARYMTGQYANDTLWSDNQGMGELDLGTAFDGTLRTLRDEVPSDIFTASGQTRVYPGMIGDSTKPFRVTVAWTDAPGNTSGAAYNNDLDLTVNVGGNTYKGNVFSGANSVTGGSADSVDNVESVFLPAGVSGAFTITITGASINSAAIPGYPSPVNQDFALVVYNSTTEAAVVAAGAALTNEPCTNGLVNPGEMVTVNLALENIGNGSTTNLVATLLSTNGVVNPGPAQTFGALAPGVFATNSFTFLADATCGQTITAVLQLQDGPVSLGTVSYTFQLGTLYYVTNATQNFDSNTSLPIGWSTSASPSSVGSWNIEGYTYDTAPYAVSCGDASTVGSATLYSAIYSLPTGSNQLSFRNSFNLESSYDGGVLEISIAGGAFQDILAAGGSFVTNGYTQIISDEGDPTRERSPVYGRKAWTGNSGGFETTIVNLPASASGTNVQFRWICGTDLENSGLNGAAGWWIDSFALVQPLYDCSSCPAPIVTTPQFFTPTNGTQLTLTSPIVQATGLAPVNSAVTISNNGSLNSVVESDGVGVFSTALTLTYGTNILTATTGTNGSSNTVVYLTLGAPILSIPTVANQQVPVSGQGAPGATILLYQSSSTNSTVATFTVNSSGNYSGAVSLAAGSNSFAATQSIDGQTSVLSSEATVNVVDVPPPAITSPIGGTVVNNGSLVLSGTGTPGAAVIISDMTELANETLASATINNSGKFSVIVTLTAGTNYLYAVQEVTGVDSPASASVEVSYFLSPVILVQPVSQTNFAGGTAVFSAVVAGAAPLHYFWENNGLKIPGATSPAYTLANIKASETNNHYTLVASNKYGAVTSATASLVLTTNPFTNLAGAYYGLFTESIPQFASSGSLTLNLTSKGKFTAKILNAGGSYSFAGTLSAVGWASATVSRGKNLAALDIILDMNVTNDGDQILGSVSSGTNWVADLEADKATFNAKSNPFPNAGKYTAVLATETNGDGYATAAPTTSGMASLRGVLPDNTSFSSSTMSVSKDGKWPLYIPLYGTAGSLVGWIQFTNGGNASFVCTNATWFRTNTDGKLYPGGFTNSILIQGSTFSTPANAALLSQGNLEVILDGADLGGSISNAVVPSANGKLTPSGSGISGLKLGLVPATGLVSGSFTDPATQKATAIKGIIFQQQTNAAGFFISGTNGGFFYLSP